MPVDIFDKKTRSRMMAGIKGKNTKMEVEAKHLFRKHGIGYRSHPQITGNPDFYLPKYRSFVFLDGCFWHKCPKHFKWPSSNRQFWKNKINSNVIRDRIISRLLKKKGYCVVRIFECSFRNSKTRFIRKIEFI